LVIFGAFSCRTVNDLQMAQEGQQFLNIFSDSGPAMNPTLLHFCVFQCRLPKLAPAALTIPPACGDAEHSFNMYNIIPADNRQPLTME
jgi:hypothetical protein